MSDENPTYGVDLSRPIHPGEILRIEFLEPLGMSQYRLAQAIHVPAVRVSQIVRGRRGITSDTALRLARFFGNSATFWLNLQARYDLDRTEDAHGAEIAEIARFDAGTAPN